jgi:hypothetical protein
LPLEIARSGRRVLVACNNPVIAFMIETLAGAPRPADFQSALAELFSTRRGAERLETHLQTLYATICPTCGESIQADGYIWRKGESEPAARLLHCPSCQSEGEYPLNAADLAALAGTGSDALHRSRAMGRIFLGDDGDIAIAEEAVRSYLPRALYVLTTLINRVDGLPTTPQRKRLLTALMLSLLDMGSALWTWPSGRSRPRQLSIPPQFKENNLWLGLDAAVAEWCSPGAPVPVTHWPELPPESGGICLYAGRLRSLLPLPEGLTLAASAAVLPRPNGAFWTLSAVWTGWLWGREAAQPMKVVFERRRYDWHWHTAALFSTFSALNQHFAPGLRLFAHLPELVPGFLAAALTASQAAGLALDGIALRGENDPGQVHWRTAQEKPRKTITTAESLLRHGIRAHLLESGEPATHLTLFAAGLQHLVEEGGLPQSVSQLNLPAMDAVTTAASKVFSDRKFLTRTGGGASEESGLYGLVHAEQAASPLPERLETYLRDSLMQHGARTGAGLEAAANRVFRGLHTPAAALLQTMVEALTEPDPSAPGLLRLRESERPAGQAGWEAETHALLAGLARGLGLRASGRLPLLWESDRHEPLLAFYVIAGGEISAVLLGELTLTRAQSVLVYPEPREALMNLRLQRDPRLLAAVEDGWRLLRADALRRFASQVSEPSLARFEELLNSDTPHPRDATQMQMF